MPGSASRPWSPESRRLPRPPDGPGGAELDTAQSAVKLRQACALVKTGVRRRAAVPDFRCWTRWPLPALFLAGAGMFCCDTFTARSTPQKALNVQEMQAQQNKTRMNT